MDKIILASGSPRRSELLTLLKIPFEKIVSDFDESSITCDDPSELVKLLAYNKAKEVSLKYKDDLVIGADTVVSINGKILGKPKNAEEAFRHLSMLQNNVHQVYSGVALIKGDKEYVTVDETKVYIHALKDKEIKAYIQTKEPMDKAGSYGIQGIGASIVKGIEGDYYNVMGLPISKLIEGLKVFNLDYFSTFLK